MCGICGKYSLNGIDIEELKRMNRVIAHRGPDDEGYYVKDCIGFGHRRLSIIDLESGKQPISNEDETIWIVYNGEIYNYKNLKTKLEEKGHKFKTNTDTEVIVHLYEEMGERCVEKLSGMFAFAIWDEKNQSLFLARDRIGQKPLFYIHNNNRFLFGSEIKSLLQADNIKREINFESIHHYLSLRFIPAPLTMFKDIYKLPAGHYLIFKEGKTKLKKYWDLDFREKIKLTEEEYIDGLENHLIEAVDSHLVSDVPVGAFLSGGLDSSTIVSLMGQILNKPFKTFSIGVIEQDFNELPYAKIVADKYRTEHHYEVVRANLIKLLPRIIWHLDEPSDQVAACMYHAAKLASKYVKVVMGGDGGDELFAGFDRYLGVAYISYYDFIPSFVRKKILNPIINSITDNFTYKSYVQKLRWIDQVSKIPQEGRFAEATAFFRFNHYRKNQLFTGSIWNDVSFINSNKIISEKYLNANAYDPIDRMLYADFVTRLSEHTLMLTDRMNMAYGLEARSPFLDHKLVEYLAKFPSNTKIKGRQLKYILRKYAVRHLPLEITKREKQGFIFPIAYWFRHDLYEFIKVVLLNSHFVQAGYFNREYVNKLIEEHRYQKVDNHDRLWMLLNLEIWHQLYIENYSHQFLQEKIESEYKIAI